MTIIPHQFSLERDLKMSDVHPSMQIHTLISTYGIPETLETTGDIIPVSKYIMAFGQSPFLIFYLFVVCDAL